MRWICLICFLLPVLGFSQSNQGVPVELSDSVSLLISLAEATLNTTPKEAERLALRARQHAQRKNHKKAEASAVLTLARAYYNQSKIEGADQTYRLAINLFGALPDSTGIGLAYNGLGNISFHQRNNFSQASAYYLEAMNYLKNDSLSWIKPLGNLVVLNTCIKRYDDAIAMAKTVYSVAARHNDLVTMSYSLNNWGNVYTDQKDYRLAIPFYQKSIAIKEKINDHMGTANTLNILALAYLRLKDHTNCEKSLEKSLAISKKYGFANLEIVALLIYSKRYADESTMKAISFCLKAKQKAGEAGLRIYNDRIFKQLSKLHRMQGRIDSADYYQVKYTTAKDSIMLEERKASAQSIANLDQQLQSLVQAKLNQPKWLRWYMPWVLAIVVALLLLHKYWVNAKSSSASPTVTSISAGDKLTTRIEVLSGQGVTFVTLTDVLWLKKEGRYYFVQTPYAEYRLKQSMMDVEGILPSGKFFRINRTVVINLTYVDNYSFWENHKYVVRMKDAKQTEFTVTRARLREMKNLFHSPAAATSLA